MTDYVFNKKYILFLCEVGDRVGRQLRNPTKKKKKKNLRQMFPGEKMEVNLESRSMSMNLFSLNSSQVALQ